MPTCIEKLCQNPRHYKQVRVSKCPCMRRQPICYPYPVVENVQANTCCPKHKDFELDPDCAKSKPVNVRLKLQLVNDGKNRNAGCLCAKYFEMLDACYGGGSPSSQGPSMPQAPQFPYFPQYYDTPVPFPVNQQQIMPTNDGLCKGACNYFQPQTSIKFRENNTQTDQTDYNKCANACEEYIEKLCSAKETPRRYEIEKSAPNPQIETLTYINTALVGITDTLKEIQTTLKYQQKDNYYGQEFKKQNQYQCCDKEPQISKHKTKLKPEEITNCLCNDDPPVPKKHLEERGCHSANQKEIRSKQSNKEPLHETKLKPEGAITNCLCNKKPYESKIRLEEHGCYCGAEKEMHNIQYSSKQSRTLHCSNSGTVPAGYISLASGMLIPYNTNVLRVNTAQNLQPPAFWPFLSKSMPPPPPPLPPPFRVLPWDDFDANQEKFNYTPQPFMNSSRLTFPGFSHSTVLKNSSHGRVSSSAPFGTVQPSGIEPQFNSFGTNYSSSNLGVTTRTPLQAKHYSSLIPRAINSPRRMDKASRVPVPEPPPLPMPSIAENSVSNTGSLINSNVGSTSTHLSFIDELKLKQSNLNTVSPLKKNRASPNKQGEFVSELKTAVEQRNVQSLKSKDSKLPVSKRIVHNSVIGRKNHDVIRHKIKNIRKDTAPSVSGSEKSNFDAHDTPH